MKTGMVAVGEWGLRAQLLQRTARHSD